MPEDTITITLRIEDAWATALGPFEYTIQEGRGNVPAGGSPLRLRKALLAGLDNTTEDHNA